jgi:hypothetical protein
LIALDRGDARAGHRHPAEADAAVVVNGGARCHRREKKENEKEKSTKYEV